MLAIILGTSRTNAKTNLQEAKQQTGSELVKQNRFAKTSEVNEEKDPLQAKNVLDLSFANKTLCLSLFNKIMSKDFYKHTKANLEINCKQRLLSQQFFLSSFLHFLHT